MDYDIEKVRELVLNIKDGKDKLNQLTSEILKKARSYTMSPEKYKEMLLFSAKFHKYSFDNAMLIQMQNPNASYVGSFKHFKELGYSVKKGEHGYKILVPVKVKYIKVKDEFKRLTSATKEERIKVLNNELQVYEKLYFKPGTVFDISQTDCPSEDLPKYLGYMSVKSDSDKQYQCILDLIEKHGIEVNVADLKSVSLKGYYRPSDDSICLNERLNSANRVKTLTHEFAHALLHKNGGNLNKAQVEFEAESVAYSVLTKVGVDLSDYSFDYIGSYFKDMKDMPEKELNSCLKRINNTSNYISDLIEKNLGGESHEENKSVPLEESETAEQKPFKHLKQKEGNYEESPFD